MFDRITIRSRLLFLFLFISLLLLVVGFTGFYAKQLSTLLIVTGAAILLSLAICMNLISSITGSIGRVNRELKRLAAGEANLGARIPVESKDEMGALSENFNALLEHLSQLVQKVQRSGFQVGSSSTELTTVSKRLESTVAQQVGSSNEVVAAATEISAQSQELVRTMNDLASTWARTADLAGNGYDGLVGMEQAMHQMDEAVRSIAGRLTAISEKANKINSVVTTISKISSQTNLLSFNAAIEAEKAGEFGQGFAVVAREIRRLSDKTDVATLDIEKMVKEMGTAVTSGVMGMDKFAEQVRKTIEEVGRITAQLSQIISEVQKLTPQFDVVSKGMEAQSQAAEQIKQAMIILSEGTRITAESLRESTLTIEHLHQTAQHLQNEVSRFRVEQN